MMKRIIASIITSLCLLFICSGVAFAGSPGDISDERALPKAIDLVKTLQESDVGLDQFGIDDFDFTRAFLGSAIPVYNVIDNEPVFNGMQYWPVYSDDNVVAVVIACPSEDGVTFVLSVDSVQGLNSFLKSNERVAIVEEGGESYFCSPHSIEKDQAIFSRGIVPSKFPTTYDVEYSSAQKKTPLVLNSVSARESASTSITTLPVRKYDQGNNPTCWASSVAVMAEYLTGTWKEPTNISLAIKGEITGGIDQDAMSAFRLYTYPGTTTTVESRILQQPVPYIQVPTWINNGMPIYAHCVNSWTRAADHAVTVLGYRTSANSGTTLIIMNSGGGHYEIASKGPGDTYYSFPYNKTSYVWGYSSVLLTGWQKPYRGNTWRYYESNGNVATGWRAIYSTWYRFASDGDMLSSTWFKDGKTWYYLQASGEMATGWHLIGGSWYFFNAHGTMLTNQWLSQGGSWYYLGSSGAAVTGWQSLGGHWYSFDGSCRMRQGWFLDGGTWYYLRAANESPSGGPAGSMLANGSWYIGNKTYFFNSSGGCTNP